MLWPVSFFSLRVDLDITLTRPSAHLIENTSDQRRRYDEEGGHVHEREGGVA
jgi:hypothetical protein